MIEILRLIVAENDLSTSLLERLHHLSEQEWLILINTASQHDLTPLLYQFLSKYGLISCLSQCQLEKMQGMARQRAVQNLILLQEAKNIFAFLGKSNIRVVGLKGIHLLDNIYSDVSLRSLSDIDILVRKRDIPDAINLLTALGFQSSTYFATADLNADIKHVPPLIKDENIYLEVHWNLLEENEPFSIDAEGLWERAVSVKIAGENALALCLEDLVLHLSIHLTYQHHLEIGLRGLYDLHLVLSQNKEQIDWDKLISRAKAWGADRVLAVTLRLLKENFNTTLPENLDERLVDGPIPAGMLAQARKQLYLEGNGGISITPDLVSLASTNGLIPKLRLILSRIFLPRTVMGRIYNVQPHSLGVYFYYPVRLAYLLSNYTRSELDILRKDKKAMQSVFKTQEKYELKRWLGKV